MAEVSYDDRLFPNEIYWFEVSEEYATDLSSTGNPWLVCLLPLAVTIGEPLRIGEVVDSQLFTNVQQLMRIWKCWHPDLHVIPIEAEVISVEREDVPERTGAFFSGGVDSFFTLLWHHNHNNSFEKFHINDLLCVLGFDVPLANKEAFLRIRERLQRVAFDLNKELIDVTTNLRETRWRKTDWTRLSFGPALGCVALLLEKRFRRVLIASSCGYKNLEPIGSHVATDHLFSTGQTKIVHDGGTFSRVEKTEWIAKSDIALRELRVCWKSRSDENCCACNKCYRTMITLELLGALEHCNTFNGSKMDIRKVAKVYSPNYYDIDLYREIRALAIHKGRVDIAKAIDRSFRNSARLKKLLRFVSSLENKRFAWKYAQLLEKKLLSHYIT